MNLEQMEQNLRQQYKKVARFLKDHRALSLTAFTIIVVVVIAALYFFISPSEPMEKQGFALVLALSLGGIAALVGLYFTRKTLRTTRQLEEDRARDTALRACLEQLGTVLTHAQWSTDTQEGSSRDPARKGATLRHVARAQTLSVLGGLDGPRKRILVRFLYESQLINNDPAPLVDLNGADLRGADLYRINLPNAYFSGVRLRGAQLSRANLTGAVLRESDLREDETHGSTDLRGTNLRGANLRDCDLRGVVLTEAYHSDGTPIPTDLEGADLENADLRGVDLRAVENLSQNQIEEAVGDNTTRLPSDLDRPKRWNKERQ